MTKLVVGVILFSAALLLVALLRFGFDVPVPGFEPVERIVKEAPVSAQPPTAAHPASPGADPRRPAAVHPLPRLVAIVERQGVREALMMGPDHTPRRYRVGDRLPGTDAQIVDIGASQVSIERTSGMVFVEPTPPAAAEQDPDAPEEDDDGDEIYQPCEGLSDAEAAECQDDVDRRVEQLQESCSRFEEDDEQWEACMDAADRLRAFPG